MNGQRTVFIISEYNPFHNGHAHQIAEIRRQLSPNTIISIMSGHFVQRGEPAVLDKFSRARLAIAGGSDLVLELPAIYATSSAEFFAQGGTTIAHGLDPNGTLSFGSETGDLDKIRTVAQLLADDSGGLDAGIREELAKGLTYPAARSQAISQLSQAAVDPDLLSNPNDILAIEYVRATLKQNLTLNFHTIRRQGMGYHEHNIYEDLTNHHPSATALRRAMVENDFHRVQQGMPFVCQGLFNEMKPNLLLNEAKLKQIIHYRLSLFPEAITQLPEGSDGLGIRIANAADQLKDVSLHDFALSVKTRRFTYSRIRRLLLHLALGFDELDYAARRRQAPSYTRILALNEKGQEFLAKTRKTREIKVIQSPREVPVSDIQPDLQAARLYSLLQPRIPADSDFTYPLRVIT